MSVADGYVIFGAGGHARVIRDIAETCVKLPFMGHVVEQDAVTASADCISESDFFARGYRRGVIGIGDNQRRCEVAERVTQHYPDFEFLTIVHPGCVRQSNVLIGSGSVVMPGVTLNTGTRVGQHCVVNTQASIDHDCVLDDYASVGPGAILGGNVQVGTHTAVSLGAHVIHRIRIGAHSIIGAGAVVLADIGDRVVAYGTPCREIRSRVVGEPYL